jgi:8-oxo-dGTP pyrophosphatase MutT (NUDIX family)
MQIAKRPTVVVSGMAVRDGRVMMGKRRGVGRRPGLWELPGGKVDLHPDTGLEIEQPEAALAREWREELDLDVVVGDWIATTPVLDLEVRFVVELYHVELVPYDEPKKLDHDDIAWWDPAYAVERLPCSPAFYLHYPALREWLIRRRNILALG